MTRDEEKNLLEGWFDTVSFDDEPTGIPAVDPDPDDADDDGNTRGVAAAAETRTGAMIALVPTALDAKRLAVDADDAEPADELHVTLAYLGKAADIPDDVQGAIRGVAHAVAEGRSLIDAEGFAISGFNLGRDDRDPCIVLGLSGNDLAWLHESLTGRLREATDAMDWYLPRQHRPWQPHVTLVYTGDLDRAKQLLDRQGPIRFDRIRVAFAGERFDFPLGDDVAAAGPDDSGGDTMPNPMPSLAERIRDAWNAAAKFSQHIVEVHAAHVIVTDEDDRSFWRVPVAVDAEQVSFGAPVKQMPAYVDFDAGAVAASTVYASRAESRPAAAASDGAPEGEPPAADTDVVDAAEGGEPAAEQDPQGEAPVVDDTTAVDADPDPKPAEPAHEPPAAEPGSTNPTEEDHVSDLSEVRSRLGLAPEADDTAVLAAIDDLRTKAETTTTNQADVAAAAATATAERDELKKEVQVLASQVETMSSKLAAAEQEKAANVKASVIEAAIKAGKIEPASREQWEKDYDEAPAAVARVLDKIAAGTAVPVAMDGEVGDPPVDGVDGDLSDAALAKIFPPGTFADAAAGKDA